VNFLFSYKKQVGAAWINEGEVSMETPFYEWIDHTADVGFRVTGETLDELFQRAGAAFTDLMVDLSDVNPVEERSLRLEGDSLDELLVAWLSELLYLFETEGLLFSDFRVTVGPGVSLTATMRGERPAPERHRWKLAVKAVTYHQAEVAPINGGWRAQVILDI
jgi:SHS2 domain-containing protein